MLEPRSHVDSSLNDEVSVLHRDIFYGLEALEGNNPVSNSIIDHGVVDADSRKHDMDVPGTFTDSRATAENAAEKAAFIEDLLAEVKTYRELADEIGMDDPDRAGVMQREMDQVSVLLRGHLADARREAAPSFEERWRAVTGKDPLSEIPQVEVDDLRGQVLEWIARSGIDVTNPKKSSTEILNEWRASQEHLGINDQERIVALLKGKVKTFVRKTVEQLKKRVPGLKELIEKSGVDFEGLQFNVLGDMRFDAGLSYIGGTRPDGIPSGAANFEWNAGRPDTEKGIVYIAAHEATHWLNAFLMDLMRRAGYLGPEAGLLTMSTSRTMLEEGLAQTIMEMMHGGDLEEVARQRGEGMVVEMLLDRLQDMVRMHTALEWNMKGRRDLDILGREIQERFMQTEHIAYKYAGKDKKFWRETRAGGMLAPAYYEGSRALRQGYQDHGIDRVLAVSMHTEGLVDLQAAQEKFGRNPESLLTKAA